MKTADELNAIKEEKLEQVVGGNDGMDTESLKFS